MDARETARSSLGECLNFNVRRVGRTLGQAYDEELRPVGLRGTQFSLLASVAAGSGLPMAELATRAGMDRTTLTQNLKPLVREGWLRIEPGRDRRVREVHLTAAGGSKLRESRPYWQRAQQRVAAQLGEANSARLLAALRSADRRLRES